MVESQRLSYFRHNQSSFRSKVLKGLEEALHRGETDSYTAGMRITLPTSFTGGMRYMFNNCQDAMAICKKYGYPDLFIIITCNSGWPKINSFITSRNLKVEDRPDISCQVFKMKLDRMIADFKKGKPFGKVDVGKFDSQYVYSNFFFSVINSF